MSASAIIIRFVDADSGKLMGEHPVPADQVPESFEAQTTLDIGANRYDVLNAEPMTRAEAVSRGFMTLRLRRADIQVVNPQEILCSLPSIANELPTPVEGHLKDGRTVLSIHEDDWRQVELLSPAAAEAAAADLADIADIHRSQRVGSGFRKLHIRKGVPEPLLGLRVSCVALSRVKGCDHTKYDGFAFEGADDLIDHGFTFRHCCGLVLYGRQRAAVVRELGLIRSSAAPPSRDNLDDLAQWIASNQLLLVDWCRVRTAGEVAGIAELLTECWPIAGQSPGRIFLGLPRDACP